MDDRTVDTGGEVDEPGAVVLTVRGHPRPQPRARVMGKGRGVAATAGRQAAQWRAAVKAEAERVVDAAGGAWAIQQRLGVGKPLELVLEVRMPTEASGRWGRWHVQRPDADNLAKLVMDAMADAGLLPGDDCAVASVRVAKRWASGAEAGVSVRLAVLEEPGAVEPAAWVRSFEPGWLRG